MGRSSKEQAARTRASIVGTASRMFRRHGVDRVSVADVMGALGLTTGGFYKHFESKDALVVEALDLAFDQSAASWLQVSRRELDDPAQRSGVMVRHYLQNRPPEQTCPMLAFAPHVAADGSDDVAVTSYTRGAEGLFEQFAQHMRACRGENSAAMADQDAKVLFAAMIGARLLAQATGEADWTQSIQAAVRAAADPGQD